MSNTARFPLILSVLALTALGASHAQAAPGDLDRAFGTKGKVLRDVGGEDFVADLVTRRNRKVVALVELDRGGDDGVGVMQLRRNGRLDRDFGRRGLARVSLAGDEYAGGIELAARGKVVISFTSDPSGADRAFGLARFRENGKPDRSLDRDGVQTTGFGTGFSGATAYGLALDGGDAIVAGDVFNAGGTRGDFAIARFSSNGTLDAGFSGDGRQTTDFQEQYDTAYGVDVDSEGRVIAVGTVDPPAGVDPLAVARYGADGELDESFSDDGILVSMIAPEGRDVVALPDDRIAVAGTVSGDFLVARFAEDGSPDAAFSGDGVQTVDFADGADTAAALARFGSKLVAVGTVRTGRRGRDFGVARLNANGTLDRKFSGDGRRAIDLAKNEDNAFGVAIDRTGDVLVGGRVERRGQGDSGIVRLQGKGGRR
jgi:uncharacterized delta-60 repeat protein